jgi:hypothetical protein
MIRKNVSGQYLYAQLNSRTDGSALTTAVSINIDGGTYGAGAGTLTHRGAGLWRYALTQGETNVDSFGYQFTHATGVAVGGTVLPVPFSAGGMLSINVEEYGGVDVTFADGTLQAVTGSVVRLAATAPSIDLKGRPFQAVAGTGASFAAVITSYNTTTKDATLDRSASALDTTTQYIIGGVESNYLVVEGSETVLSVLRGVLSLMAGNITGLPTAFAFKNQAGTTTRIAGTVDGDGNRTVTSVDFT